jgi:hypothetical protein
MHRLITILTLILTAHVALNGQNFPAELEEAIGKGDAARMSAFFHQSLEMTILDNDYKASKNQATRIMESFFKKHAPTQFKVSFEGVKEQSKYAIGTLITKEGAFRMNIFFLNKEGKRLIYYLSIEKETPYEIYPRP